MADDFPLLADRQVVLVIWAADFLALGLIAADVDEKVGQLEISLLARHAIKFHQGQFDLFVAGHFVALVGAKGVVEAVGQLDGHVQQRPLAGGAVVGHGGLDEVARAIKLVLRAKVGEPLARLGENEVGVQIAVGPLGGGDLGNHLVDGLLQGRVRLVGQASRTRLPGPCRRRSR